MIAKHISARAVKPNRFADLVDYLTDPRSQAERVENVQVTNCRSDDPAFAAREVLATQAQNTRAGSDKTYHLMISFRPGEEPSPEVIKAVEERLCDGLGFEGHQRVSAVHRDTDNLHIHVAINKVHPETLTIHTPFRDYWTLGVLAAHLENEHGLQVDNHQSQGRTGGANRAEDMERHAGVESLVGWVRRNCLDDLKAAQSWDELHRTLQKNGLQLRERGAGCVIADGNGTMARASTVDRALSRSNLEKRLGAFEPAPVQANTAPEQHYEKRPLPMRIDTTELFARYQVERKEAQTQRSKALAPLRERKERDIERLKASNRARRAEIKHFVAKGSTRKLMYAQESREFRGKLEEVKKRYQEQRQAVYEQTSQPAWADWLKAQAMKGDEDALTALRAREARQMLQGETIQGQGARGGGAVPVIDSITKKGTILYRGDTGAIRDDGERLQMRWDASAGDLQAALRVALQRHGSRIKVNGTDEFKERMVQAAATSGLPVTFDDQTLEHRRQQLQAMTVSGELPERHREQKERDVTKQDLTPRPLSPEQAADRYIAEREEKRLRGMTDILAHSRYTAGRGTLAFAGTRKVDGQTLALLQRDESVMVLPVSEVAAQRLKRVPRGAAVTVTARGSIRQAAGRSR